MKAPLALGPLLLSALLLAPLSAQRPHFPGGPGGPRGEAGQSGEGGPSKKKAGIQPYDKVIKKEFQHQRGLFLVHRGTVDGDEKVFYEIPADAFGEDLLWVTQMEKTEAGFGYGGTSVGNRVVRWELRGEKVLLRDVKFAIRAEGGDTIRNSVEATSLAPIIQAFPVRAWGKDKAPVIDVTGLFTDDLPEFSAKRRLNASGVDIIARMTALQKLHKAYAVTGAVCLGTAAKIEGTIVNEIFSQVQPSNPPAVRIGHPSGTIQVEIEIEKKNGHLKLTKAALARTARLLMDGHVYVPDR
ncbi:MAG: PrpF domain-containing protein [Planctomycetota bacterium]